MAPCNWYCTKEFVGQQSVEVNKDFSNAEYAIYVCSSRLIRHNQALLPTQSSFYNFRKIP